VLGSCTFLVETLRIVFTVLKHPTCVSLWFCAASVVGPALTFRIRQNVNNMTAADVAAKAGEAQNTQTHEHLPQHEVKSRPGSFFPQISVQSGDLFPNSTIIFITSV